MKVYYHGTTVECADNIRKHGFGRNREVSYPREGLIWDCSDPDCTYMYSEHDEHDEGDAANEAEGNAILSAAVSGSQASHVVVFRLEIPDDVADKFCEVDYSCENMADRGAFYIDNDILNQLIDDGTIVLLSGDVGNYNPEFRWFYVAQLVNQDFVCFSQSEMENIEMAKRLSNGAFILDY